MAFAPPSLRPRPPARTAPIAAPEVAVARGRLTQPSLPRGARLDWSAAVATQMIEINEARVRVLQGIAALPSEVVELRSARGRFLAEDVVAEEDVPGFDGAAMDGYAVRAADTRGAGPLAPVALRIVDESRAGHPATASLGAAQAIAISTGAALPSGADAVVRVEETSRSGDRVELAGEVEPGRDVRRTGDDLRRGGSAVRSGTLLGAAELGVLASAPRTAILCTRRPRVSILTTGDELIEPGEPMRPGAVRNSNAYSIPSLVEQAGAEIVRLAAVGDDAAATEAAIATALSADVCVICGGVSVGAHDHVKSALGRLGVDEIFWGIALKPGKPTWFGRHGDQQVFGLPGNPVSAMVTFVLLVHPALIALGGGDPARQRATARLANGYAKEAGRAHAVPCRLELRPDGWEASLAAAGSHVLSAMLGADGIALIPAESESLSAGASVEVELLDQGGLAGAG